MVVPDEIYNAYSVGDEITLTHKGPRYIDTIDKKA
jgi:hypothetical protein